MQAADPAARGSAAIAAGLTAMPASPRTRGKSEVARHRRAANSSPRPCLLGHAVVTVGDVGAKGMPGYKKGPVIATRRGKDGQPIKFTA